MSLRILMTLDAMGGVWRYALDLGAALVAAGHHVVFAGQGPAPSPEDRREAVMIGPLEWSGAPLDWMAPGPEALRDVPGWLEGLVARHRPDVLHLNLPSQAAGLRGGPPRVVVTHSCLATWFRAVEGTPVPQHLAWLTRITAEGFRAADRIVAPSAAHAALTGETYGLTGIAAVPNAGRSPLCAPDAGDGGVVAAARWWDKGKNGAVLDRAAAHLDAPVTLLGACDGPDGQRFAAAHATTAGALPHGAAMDRIARASLFVSPSRFEPFGLAALEAARAGRPLLLADIPVYRELWDGAAAFFDPGDAGALARRIAALLASPAQRLRLGRAAQTRAERFDLQRQAAAMTDIYKKVTAPAAVRYSA
jgi:glycosyltransferase involved in cell wall biosynthesis